MKRSGNRVDEEDYGTYTDNRGKETIETHDLRHQGESEVWAGKSDSGPISSIDTRPKPSRLEIRDYDNDMLGRASGGDVTSKGYMTPMELKSQMS